MIHETLIIDLAKQNLVLDANCIHFKEGDSFIIYLPSLNISAYGDSLVEAKEMFQVCLEEFTRDIFFNLKSYSAIEAYLKELGWKSTRFSNKKMFRLSEISFVAIIKEFGLPESTMLESFEEKYSIAV